MTFAQRRNRLMTHFSERIPVVKRRMTVPNWNARFSVLCAGNGRQSASNPVVHEYCVLYREDYPVCCSVPKKIFVVETKCQ